MCTHHHHWATSATRDAGFSSIAAVNKRTVGSRALCTPHSASIEQSPCCEYRRNYTGVRKGLKTNKNFSIDDTSNLCLHVQLPGAVWGESRLVCCYKIYQGSSPVSLCSFYALFFFHLLSFSGIPGNGYTQPPTLQVCDNDSCCHHGANFDVAMAFVVWLGCSPSPG